MALVSFSRRMIFCPSAGTASTSISEFLLRHADFQWMPEKSFVRGRYLIDYKHSGLFVLNRFGLVDPDFVAHAWSFALVRNPFSWYLSEFLRHRLWIVLLRDPPDWVRGDPNVRSRIVAAQGDFLGFCRLMMQQNRPAELDARQHSWDLFHWTASNCSAIFRYEEMPVVQTELVGRLGLDEGCCLPYVNKTPVSTLLRGNLDLFRGGADEVIAATHWPTFARYGYATDVTTSALTEPDIAVPTSLPADFSPATYLELNPDLREVGIDPVRHYLAYGQFELRKYK